MVNTAVNGTIGRPRGSAMVGSGRESWVCQEARWSALSRFWGGASLNRFRSMVLWWRIGEV